jgi:hypothetical protein
MGWPSGRAFYVAYVERLVELGLIPPADAGGPGALAGRHPKVRFRPAFEDGGLPLDGIARRRADTSDVRDLASARR